VVGKRHEIEIVASRVSLENQHAFDAQNLGLYRDRQFLAEALDLHGFQWLVPDQLPHTPVSMPSRLPGICTGR